MSKRAKLLGADTVKIDLEFLNRCMHWSMNTHL